MRPLPFSAVAKLRTSGRMLVFAFDNALTVSAGFPCYRILVRDLVPAALKVNASW